MSALHPNFSAAMDKTKQAMRDYSKVVHTQRWQGIDISRRPEGEMKEILSWDFRVPMAGMDLEYYQMQISPNLPWADEHFAERICGYPMNPGESWKTWPWAQSAAKFTDAKGRFEVNYMERFWGGADKAFADTPEEGVSSGLHGIRGRPYGDLGSIVKLFLNEPLTRQGYLPIYWPEDTGAGGRIPCTLGYYWIMRGGYLHMHYPIRSCDFYRHFRDDVYLAVRLSIWLLEQLREHDPNTWHQVKLGYYSMWIGSLHMFVNDYRRLFPSAS